MATNTTKKRIVKYLNRDFESFKKDIIEHLKIYFPDTIQDFNESSVGIMLVEIMSVIGDNLSFYLDKKFNESFIETAKERKNIFKHAKQLGFKAFGKASATGTVDAFIKVPATTLNEEIIPNMSFAGKIKKGAKLKGDNGETYETLLDIDFSKVNDQDLTKIAVADRDTTTQQPTSFALKVEDVDIKAGESKSVTVAVGGYQAFRKITLADDDVLEVLEVKDSEGNIWYEVDFLAQDTIFDGVSNTGDDANEVPYVLKLRSVPFRFITEYDVDTNRMSLIFGSGDAQTFDGDLIPDLGDLALPLYGRDTFTDFSLDPQNFLKTRTLGLAPTNTTFSIKYRIGGGLVTNAGAGTITTVVDSIYDVGDSTLNAAEVRDVGNTFSVSNPKSISGGRDELSINELKQLISANFAAQGRMVVLQDFTARSLSMPSRFGSVFRAYAKLSGLNKNAIELITLSRNSDGHVIVSPLDLKKNLKKYLNRFRMVTDAIEILDGEIINIGIEFNVLTNPDFNSTEVLSDVILALKEFFEIQKWQINQPINLTTIYSLIAGIPGVLSLIDIRVINRSGTGPGGRSYSTTTYNITENTKNGIIYCKENAIFEVKFPNVDIIGTAK
jgi:hypothetical protein